MWTVPMIAQAVTYPCAPVTLTINGSQITVVMTCPSPSPTPSPKPTATPTPTPTPTSSPSPTPSPSATPIANALLDPTFSLGITGANAKWTQATGTWALSGSTLQAPGQGAQANYNIISSPVTVAPGEVISVSGYIDDTHVASGTGPGTIQLDSGSTGGPIVAETSQVAGKAGTVSLTYTVPSGISQLWFQFSNHDALVPAGLNESFSAPFLGIVSGAPSPSPSPSPSPVPGAALPASYCIGGSLYTLGWFDNFAAPGETLSVSDTWPPPAGTKWSNQFYWGRTNNAGLDLALYPSQAQMAALWPTLAPVAKIIPGVGLDLHSEPVPTPTTAAQHTALCSNGGDTTCRTYLSGMLGNAVTATTGFWVAREQLAPNNATGESWWDSSWLFNNTPGVGNANELDNPEQWPAAVLGANVVQQTEQCYTPCTAGSVVGYRGVLPTSQTAMNTFESLVTSTYMGVYINNVPTSSQMRLNSTGPLAWLLTAQVNGTYGVTPGPGATADYLVQYVAYYAPSTTPCSGGLATPSP